MDILPHIQELVQCHDLDMDQEIHVHIWKMVQIISLKLLVANSKIMSEAVHGWVFCLENAVKLSFN